MEAIYTNRSQTLHVSWLPHHDPLGAAHIIARSIGAATISYGTADMVSGSSVVISDALAEILNPLVHDWTDPFGEES